MEETPTKQRIVEIGPGMLPIFMELQNPTLDNIGKGVDYTAIDCDPENVKKFEKFYGKRGQIIQGYVQEIPLPDEYANQIWLMNVFGRFEYSPSNNKGGPFKELTRILKKGGTIYIGEIYGPDRSDLLERDYSELGLDKKTYEGLSEVREFWKRMGGDLWHFDSLRIRKDEHPFFLELTKK